MDMIDRQQAIDYLAKTMPHDDYGYELSEDEARKIWADIINKIPTAEPQIIRCKDCKHLFNKDDEGGKCWHFNGFSKVVSYDDFCSCAERRTDG